MMIRWNDNSISVVSLLKLRENCPCASCSTIRLQLSKSIKISNENQIKIRNVKQIGNYAIQITWEDGHNLGIYEFSFLKRI